MPIIRAGRDTVAGLIVGTAVAAERKYDSTGAVIWVSSSTAGHNPATTWFGSAGGVASTMEATYPLRATNILQFRGGYTTGQANFEWNQWLLHNASQSDSGNPLLMSLQSCFIQKTNQQSVQFTTCVTITT